MSAVRKRRHFAPRHLGILVAAALLMAACSSDDDAAWGTASATESATAPASATGVARASATATATATTEASASASASASAPASAPATTAAEATASAFPLTVSHKFGNTTVPAPPERVVSIGYSDQDDLLALGVAPIAVRDWFGDQPFAVWPWAQPALGDAEPVVLSSAELNFEQIAALSPDLIIGVSSGMTQDDYDLLGQIAPTVAQSGDYVDWGMPWDERTMLVGTALGMSDEAADLVAAVQDRFADVRVQHPEFAGATAAVAFFWNDQPGAYGSQDTRSRIMADLGFEIPDVYDEIAGESFYASFSEEQTGLLDVDVLVWTASTDEGAAAIAASPLRSGLAVFTEGREVFIGQELTAAFSFASPLSFHYLLDNLVPELAAAVDGSLDTPVASAAALGVHPEPRPPSADAQAAMAAWSVVFDSAADFADKAPHLEDAANLATSNAAYAATGEGTGGISLGPTAATVDGDIATITYNVLFGQSVAYRDLSGEMNRIGDTWMVSRATYCGFLASARTPCE